MPLLPARSAETPGNRATPRVQAPRLAPVPTPEYPILTERLRLRPFTEADADALYDIQSRPDVARYLYWEPATREWSAESLRKRLGRTTFGDDPQFDSIALAVDLRADEAHMIGDVVLWRTSVEHRQAELGYVFHPDHAGNGYATEAAKALLRLGFESYDLHRIVGKCDARNTKSSRVLERAGMRKEAHHRENEFVKGAWADELVYAILASEWRATTT